MPSTPLERSVRATAARASSRHGSRRVRCGSHLVHIRATTPQQGRGRVGPMATKGFRSAGHTPSLVAALVHFDVSFMVWVLLGALGAFVASDLHLSATQKGLMVAVPPLGGAV